MSNCKIGEKSTNNYKVNMLSYCQSKLKKSGYQQESMNLKLANWNNNFQVRMFRLTIYQRG